jgi:hypothetical protein
MKSVPSILYVGCADFMGGAEKALLNLLTRIHPGKIQARVIIFGKPGRVKSRLDELSIQTICVPHLNFSGKAIWFLLPFVPIIYLWRLWKIFRFAQVNLPDIIHGWGVPAYDVGVLLSSFVKRPVVVSVHIGLNTPRVPRVRKWSIR